MKKVLLTFMLMIFPSGYGYCQLPDGATAPDFTFTDINGTSHHLYSYLDEGKFVALDIFTTWCHPCWYYDTSGVMDSLYRKHDSPGDGTWKVLSIEADASTTIADLQGTGTNTVGNWVGATQFPIMNPTGAALNDFTSAYNISFYPTLFVICPNKKIYQDTLNKGYKPSLNTWEYAAAKCGLMGLSTIDDLNSLRIFPNPAREETTLSFSLNSAVEITLSVSDLTGRIVGARDFGKQPAGGLLLTYDVHDFNPGLYIFTISDSGGRKVRRMIVVQ